MNTFKRIRFNLFNFVFLQTFFSKFYSVDRYAFPDEPEMVNKLASALLVRRMVVLS